MNTTLDPVAQQPTESLYVACKNTYVDWTGHQREDYAPTARQLPIIAAVASALDAGLYYSDAVRKHCATRLRITAEQSQVGAKYVEGGEFGMDCYYARRYLDAQARFKGERETVALLKPQVGMLLGTLLCSDGKRTTGLKVIAIASDGITLTLQGKRGALPVQLFCSATSVRRGIDNAAERGHRKDDFAAFTAASTGPVRKAARSAAKPRVHAPAHHDLQAA